VTSTAITVGIQCEAVIFEDNAVDSCSQRCEGVGSHQTDESSPKFLMKNL